METELSTTNTSSDLEQDATTKSSSHISLHSEADETVARTSSEDQASSLEFTGVGLDETAHPLDEPSKPSDSDDDDDDDEYISRGPANPRKVYVNRGRYQQPAPKRSAQPPISSQKPQGGSSRHPPPQPKPKRPLADRTQDKLRNIFTSRRK
ncbi:hypothetical protein M422DRAFT_63179 [Sphaerobolus stellatus SS14]|nr:hypothetical protein M422DRAFT_63179 [Sphaerobolus stellatus SS14]